nr:hypothetical protein B0A51_05912 [Rachicladosporium sp. CCFEE 5018]
MRAESSVTKEWLPWKLELPWMLAMLLLEFSVFATILALTVLSLKKDGFVPVAVTKSRNILGLDANQQLLWKTLSAVFMALPALDVSNAFLAYNASKPTWMDAERSYDPFESAGAAGNLTARTSVYYTSPDCRVIPVQDGTITIDPASKDSGRVWVSYVDRGCNVTQNPAAISPDRLAYVYAFFQPCGGDVSPVDRLGLFAATYDASASNLLRNTTIVSCKPTYWSALADVTVSLVGGQARQILNVSSVFNETAQQSTTLRSLGSDLSLYELYTPSAQLKSNALGNAVHAYASTSSAGTDFSRLAWSDSMAKVYKTIFAATASLVLTEDLPALEIQKTRDGSGVLRVRDSTKTADSENNMTDFQQEPGDDVQPTSLSQPAETEAVLEREQADDAEHEVHGEEGEEQQQQQQSQHELDEAQQPYTNASPHAETPTPR